MVATSGRGWVLAQCLVSFFEELDRAYPGRPTASDGTIGDLAHRARISQHNPEDDPTDRDPTEYVCAGDFTNGGRVDAWRIMQGIAANVLAGTERRVRYLVSGPPSGSTDMIFSQGKTNNMPWAWRPKASADHKGHHGHISVWNTAAARRDVSSWLRKGTVIASPVTPAPPTIWSPINGGTVKLGLVTITLDGNGRGWKDVCPMADFIALTPHGQSPPDDGYRSGTPQFAVQDRGGKARVEVIGGGANGKALCHVASK